MMATELKKKNAIYNSTWEKEEGEKKESSF